MSLAYVNSVCRDPSLSPPRCHRAPAGPATTDLTSPVLSSSSGPGECRGTEPRGHPALPGPLTSPQEDPWLFVWLGSFSKGLFSFPEALGRPAGHGAGSPHLSAGRACIPAGSVLAGSGPRPPLGPPTGLSGGEAPPAPGASAAEIEISAARHLQRAA